MLPMDDNRLRGIRRLVDSLGNGINWTLTGSTAHRLQGVDVTCRDLDVQTDKEGAYGVAEVLAEWMVQPTHVWESAEMRSHFGKAYFDDLDLEVEIMGAIQKRKDVEGAWSKPTDPLDHRVFVKRGGLTIPVLSLAYEASAYEAIGRLERAALLRFSAE